MIDLAALKITPGDYTFAFHSLGICRYPYNPATTAANPKDTVEILISQPIRVSVKPASPKTAGK